MYHVCKLILLLSYANNPIQFFISYTVTLILQHASSRMFKGQIMSNFKLNSNPENGK